MLVPEGYILITKAEYEQLHRVIKDFQRTNEELQRTNEELQSRIKELEARLSMNSSNSSKPPSSDGYKKRVQNNREKSHRKAGGQNGHEGYNLKMVENPDVVILHKAEQCEHCGTKLEQVVTHKHERRQVHDLPPINIIVTEHQIEHKICPCCGKEAIAPCPVSGSVQYGERIKSLGVYLNQYQMLPFERTREVMDDLFGACPSAEVLQQSNELCYDNLEQTVETVIKESLISSAVMNNDETGIRCEKDTKWIHVHSTGEHTYYAMDDKRGEEAMERIGILPRFQGNSVHDRWASYDMYDNCQHSYCNAHLLRELKAEEENKKPWASDMKTVLLDAHELSKQEHTDTNRVVAIVKRYDNIVKKAIKQEPIPQKTPHKRGRVAKSKSLRLLECFRDKNEKVLRFLYDKNVPFDNNLAERDLRMVKLKQKISGCFRTRKGADVFCRIRSYISTVKKQGGQVWEMLQMAMKTSSFQPIEIRGG